MIKIEKFAKRFAAGIFKYHIIDYRSIINIKRFACEIFDYFNGSDSDSDGN